MNIIPYPKEIKLTYGNTKSTEIIYINDASLEREAYKLIIANDGVKAYASSQVGFFYAKQTFLQIKEEYKNKIPCCEIIDAPSYKHRGFMLDSARHYQEIEDIKQIIDELAKIKINKFHWHLTDDQGWRIDIEKYPQLKKSAIREKSTFSKKVENKPYGRLYSKNELKEIVKYCSERHIDVIPEFDVPGHTSAFLSQFADLTCDNKPVNVKTRQGIYKSVICPAKQRAYEVLDDIFSEMCDIFPYDYFHIGGDESPRDGWKACDACKELMKELELESYDDYHNYFMNKVADILKSHGKKAIVWNDVTKGKNLNTDTTIQYWKERDKGTYNFANNGGKIILSPFGSYYLDYDYEISSLKNAYKFNTELKALSDEGRNNILGIEAPLWCEYVDNSKRAQELIFPRIFAIAEVGWNANDKAKYSEFRKRCVYHAEKISNKGINVMPQTKWDYSKAMMVKGWLSFVFKNYSLEYIKSAIKGDL